MNQDSSSGNNVTYLPASENTDASAFEPILTSTVSSTEQPSNIDVLVLDLECSNGHLCHFDIHTDDVQWQLVEADERQMGTESHFEAEIILNCNDCNAPMTITLHLWEYPDGVFNSSEVEVENGQLAHTVDDYTMKSFFERCGH